MKKLAVIIGLSLLFLSPGVRIQAVDLDDAGKTPTERLEKHDRTHENACDCCQKCKSAKSTQETEEEEGVLENDGCEDCCGRCGQPLTPTPHETPPEIMDRKPPPDIIEKER